MPAITQWNQSLSVLPSLATELPFDLMQPVLDPVSHPSHLASEQSFHAFIEQIHAKGILPSDSQSFTQLMHFMGEIQAQAKSLEDRLTFLNSTKPKNATYHQQQITDVTTTLEKLKGVQQAFDKACYKSEGKGLLSFAKRLFGNETWEQWATARTDLGQLVVLVSDHLQGGLTETKISIRLSKLDLIQAMTEARAILNELHELQDLEHLDTAEPMESFKAEARQLSVTYEAASFLAVLGGSGNDFSYAIQGTNDGGFILSGQTTSFGVGGWDVLLAKLNHAGEVVWAHALGGSSTEYGYAIQATADGGFVFSGYTASFGAGGLDVLVAKMDHSGKTLWAHVLGGNGWDESHVISETADGGFILSGYTKSFGAGHSDVLLAKLNHAGEVVWAHALGGGSNDFSYALRGTNDGGFVLSGSTYSFGAGNYDVLVAKLDYAGELLWAYALGGSSYDWGRAIQETADGGFILSGYTDSFGAGQADALVAKLDGAGELLWAHTFGGSSDDSCYAISKTADGGFVLLGSTSSFGAGNVDMLVAKLNHLGKLLWSHTLGGSSSDYGYAISETADGSFVLTGHAQSFGAGSYDVFVAKLNASGWSGDCSSIVDITGDITFTNITDDITNEAITPSWLNITDVISVSDAALVQTNITDSIQQNLTCQATYAVVEDGLTTIAPNQETTNLAPSVTEGFFKLFGRTKIDMGFDIEQTADGGFVLTGYTVIGSYQLLAAKLNATGYVEWMQSFWGGGQALGLALTKTQDGGLIYTGRVTRYSSDGWDAALIKLDTAGRLLWSQEVGGMGTDYGYDVKETSNGDLVIAGYSDSFGVGNEDVFVARFNRTGGLKWAQVFGGNATDMALAMDTVTSGGMVIAGYTNSFGAGSDDALVAKIADDGKLLWVRTVGGTGVDWGRSIQETKQGDLLMAGYTENFNAWLKDFLVVKLDGEGDLLWVSKIALVGSEYGYNVKETSDGGCVVTGYTTGSAFSYYDLLVVKLDQYGALLWARIMGGSVLDSGYAIEELNDGGFLITGTSDSFGTGAYDYDLAVIKLDANGWMENCSSILAVVPTVKNITSEIIISEVVANVTNITDSVSIDDLDLTVTNITNSFPEQQICPDVELVDTTVAPAMTTAQPVTSAPKPGIPGNQLRNPIVNLKDGGYAIMGIDTNVTDGIPKFEFLRMNETGGMDWIWQWPLDSTGYDKMVSSVETSDGGMVLLGRTGRYGAGDYDILIVKLNATGDVEWSNTLGGNHSDISHSIQETVAGDLVITGRTYSLHGDGWDVLVAKLNATGGLQWVCSVGGSKEDVGRSVQVTLEDDVLIAGHSKSFGQGGSDMLLLHLNATGHMNRSWVFGTSKHEHGYTIEGLADGGIALGGYTNGFGSGSYDALLARVNASGDLWWYGAMGGVGSDMAFTVFEDVNGTLVLDGFSNAQSTHRDRMQGVLEADGTITYCSAAFIDTPAALNTSASFLVEPIDPIQKDLSDVMQVQSAPINASQVGSSFLESVVNFRTCVVNEVSNASRRVLGALNKGSSKVETAFKAHSSVVRSHEFIEPVQVRSESQRSDRGVDQVVLTPKL